MLSFFLFYRDDQTSSNQGNPPNPSTRPPGRPPNQYGHMSVAEKQRLFRGSNWCFTLHASGTLGFHDPTIYEFIDQLHLLVSNGRCAYWCYGRERAPGTGRPHLQGYIRLTSPTMRDALKRELHNNQVHLQKAYGTSEQAIRYCKKGGDFEESGEAPITTAQGRKEALQIKKILEDVCQGKSTDELIMQYPNQLRFITEVSRMRRPRDCIAKCLYLYGNAGCGKTYSTAKVLDQLGLSYYKKCPRNKWFDNYDCQDVIVFEEFTSCLPLCTFLSYTDARPPLM